MNRILVLALVAVLGSGFAAQADQEVRGGQIVRVGGRDYELSDLHFRYDEPAKRFYLDKTMSQLMMGWRNRLARELNIRVGRGVPRSDSFADFFRDDVLSTFVEYEFVETLPPCQFVPRERLPEEAEVFEAACTQGSRTFIRPDKYALLSVEQRALLLIHERLHDLAPRELIDVKVGFTRGLYRLFSKYWPALDAGKETIEWTDEEFSDLNNFSYRAFQLSGRPTAKANHVAFTRDGGVLKVRELPTRRLPTWKVGPGVRVGLGSEFVVTGRPMSRIAGYNFDVVRSRIRAQGDLNFSGQNLRLENADIVLAPELKAVHLQFDGAPSATFVGRVGGSYVLRPAAGSDSLLIRSAAELESFWVATPPKPGT